MQVFDPRLLELFASGRLVAVWTNDRPFIEQERERHGDPGLYDQLQVVAERWSGPTAPSGPATIPAAPLAGTPSTG